jgi:Mce-associated membrane protein
MMNLRRFNLLLLLVGLALGVALALILTRASDAPPGETEAQRRDQANADVTRAATAEVQAFLGIDHERVDEQAQTVLDGATGDFEQQYADALDNLRKSAAAQQSTAVATVLEVGISAIDSTRAKVLVAANTEVTSKSTDGEARTVPWRIQLDMVKEGGRWLTSGLRFVG